MYSLKSKRCLITGASSGLGLELTKIFIREGAEVIMLCRDEEKSLAAIKKLKEAYPDAKIRLELADFSSFKSLKAFIKRFKEKCASLDILINNAALLKAKLSKTEDGFELMFQVNYLAPFMLTNSLTNTLKHGTDPCIINIALPSEKLRIDFEDIQTLQRFKPMTNLMKSKLCFFLYSIELAERIKETGIKVLTGIPNSRPFKSSLGRELPFYMGLIMKLISVKTEDIAINILNVLSMDTLQIGYVFKGTSQVPLTRYWQDKGLRHRLWRETESLL